MFFPNTVVPLLVGRTKSLNLIDDVIKSGSVLGVVAQKEDAVENPTKEELYNVGTLAKIIKFSKNSDGHYNVIIEGLERFEIENWRDEEPYFTAEVKTLEDIEYDPLSRQEIPILFETLRETAYDICYSLPELPTTIKNFIETVQDPGTLADIIASNLGETTPEKQEILETYDVVDRMLRALELLGRKHEMLTLSDKINNSVKEEISKNQREYYLRQQLRAINQELGESAEENEDLNVLKEKLKTIDLPDEIVKTVTKEIKKTDQNFKIKLIESLWKIIYSDNKSDMFEDNLMRRITGLVYLDKKLVGDIKEKIKKLSTK